MKKFLTALILFCLGVFTATAGYSAPVSAALKIGTEINQPVLRDLIAAPSQLTAKADGTAVTLRWEDNSTNETVFEIERKGSGGTFGPIVTLRSNTNSYVDTGLQAGAQYTYRVRAMTSTSASPYSNEASVSISGSVSVNPNIQIGTDRELHLNNLLWEYDILSGKAIITRYKGAGGDVTVPSTLEGAPVIRIDTLAFKYCTSLTSIVIPGTVTSIGMDTFRGCTNLKKVTLPDTVISIGLDCFAECSSLTSINLPSGLSEIDWGTFSGCSSLTDIAIPANVKRIGPDVFLSCTGLTEVILPSNLSLIDPSAFRGCRNLTSLSIAGENSAFTTADGVLYGKDKSTLLIYPEGKMTDSVKIADHVKSIGPSAFFWAGSLREIILPNGLTSIGKQAFGYSGLTSVRIPATVKAIGYGAFEKCTNLKTVWLPGTLTAIESDTFNGCTNLSAVALVNGVQSIGLNAFNGCSSLKEIYLPSTIKTIGKGAFQKCPALRSMWFYGNPPNIDWNAVDYRTDNSDDVTHHDSDVILYYPRSLEQAWLYEFNYWGWDIQPFDPLNTKMMNVTPGIELKDLTLTGQTTVGQSTSGRYPGPLPDGTMSIQLGMGKTDFGVNGQPFSLDTSPIMLENRMMLPVRYVAEPLGAVTEWNPAEQKVTVTFNNKKIELWVGRNTARINGKDVSIDSGNPNVKPVIVPPGRTMLPLRFVGEALGCEVAWDAKNSQAIIKYQGNKLDPQPEPPIDRLDPQPEPPAK